MTSGGPALSESILVVPELLFCFRLDPVQYHSVEGFCHYSCQGDASVVVGVSKVAFLWYRDYVAYPPLF